jgi:hypothetical protein
VGIANEYVALITGTKATEGEALNPSNKRACRQSAVWLCL